MTTATNFSSCAAGGIASEEIRFPAGAGIAGECFSSGRVINIADAYSDPRFNPEFDRQTGYRTHSMLCMPIVARGEQDRRHADLNRKGGSFERRRKASAGVLGAGRGRHRKRAIVRGCQRRAQLKVSEPGNTDITVDTDLSSKERRDPRRSRSTWQRSRSPAYATNRSATC
ncbi:MAG: GAF domain-containing protein [Burkholderiaceae bacterium]|nr:GAF domain-containing protein [Burkholderiaceae bacterium]